MNPQETQQVVARDEKWVPSTERVKISSTNVRLETTLFWCTIKKDKDSEYYEFLLANKKCIVDAKVFRKILDICPRLEDVHQVLNWSNSPKKSRGKGSQGKKIVDFSQETVDVFEESEPEPAMKRTASRRVVKKKVTISADDNIISDPYVALEIVTESVPEPAKKKTRSRGTRSTPKSKPAASKPKLKGVQSLTPEEQEAADVMQTLKERDPDESTVISATSTEGT
ncbi:hypothetical protein Tco_0760328, partial [Tanacetum coccineum]